MSDDRHDWDGDGWCESPLGCAGAEQLGGGVRAFDCDDSRNWVHPDAEEVCDGVDNDCDLDIDEYLSTVGFPDSDGDGVGAEVSPVVGCSQPPGFVTASGDCDDTDPDIHPGAEDVCDGVDNDCDCNWDTNDDGEVCSWGDANVDEEAGTMPVYPDGDGDGFGQPSGAQWMCEERPGFADNDQDCDDTDLWTHPGAPEICDGRVNDCGGELPADELDLDLDGFIACAGDCDDSDPDIRPGVVEKCDGRDTDCDGELPADELDADGDLAPACDDCDDTAPDRFPGNIEVCDGLDNDCDGSLSPAELDGDGDGVTECDGDCDDKAAQVFPGSPEVCDGEDTDCDPTTDELADDDGDGASLCDGDCDDSDELAGPLATEDCDGVDDDCDGVVDDSCLNCTVTLAPVSDLQFVVDSASDRDVICLLDGDYAGPIDLSAIDLTLVGLAGRAVTTIDGGGGGPVITVGPDPGLLSTAIRGLTITGGDAERGGGLHLERPVSLSSLLVTGNTATWGGGLSLETDLLAPQAALDDVIIEGNEATQGGGGASFEGSLGGQPLLLLGVTIDGNLAGSDGGGLRVAGGAGIALQRSLVAGNEAQGAGGGLWLGSGSSAGVTDGMISQNVASGGDGGGVAVLPGATLTLLGTSMTDNLALERGGAVSAEGAEVVAEGVELGWNQASDGGAVAVENSDLALSDSFVIANAASGSGAGVWFQGDGDDTLSVAAVLVGGNVAQASGGGLWIADCHITGCAPPGPDHGLAGLLVLDNQAAAGGGMALLNTSIELENVALFENLADQGPPMIGGGLYLYSADVQVAGLVVAANEATVAGGALYLDGASPEIDNAVLIENQAMYGAAVRAVEGAKPVLSSTIVAYNQPGPLSAALHPATGGSISLRFSALWDNGADFMDMDDPIGTWGNLAAAPMFLDVTAAEPLAWDLHLAPTSPLVNEGDPDLPDPLDSSDLDAPGDIGAFGGPTADDWDLDCDGSPNWWQPGAYDTTAYPALGFDCNDLAPGTLPGVVDPPGGADLNCDGVY